MVEERLAKDSILIHRLFDSPPNTLCLERLQAGETNRDYKVERRGALFVARLPYEGSTVVDRDIESRNLLRLLGNPNTASVMPNYERYIYKERDVLGHSLRDPVDILDGTAVTRYIAGVDMTTALLRDRQIQRSLVRTLNTFHTSEVVLVNEYDPFEIEITKYRRIVESADLSVLVSAQTIFEMIEIEEELRARLPVEKALPAHNDLVFGNLRVDEDGLVHLLDPEYAGLSRRWPYDFGTLLGENLFCEDPMDEDLFGEILEEASGVYGTTIDPRKARDAALVNILVTFWWGIVEFIESSGGERDKYLEYVTKRANKIKTLI